MDIPTFYEIMCLGLGFGFVLYKAGAFAYESSKFEEINNSKSPVTINLLNDVNTSDVGYVSLDKNIELPKSQKLEFLLSNK